MTELVCKPLKEPVVKGKRVYAVYMNRTDLGLRVRARNAAEADLMIQICFLHELPGKTLDYDINQFKENDNGNEEDKEGQREGEEGGQEGAA